MTAEIALREVNSPAEITTTGPDPTGGRLVAWAEGLAAAHRIGSALCQTAFAPKHFAGKPEEAAAAILFGDEVGLSPTQALRSIHVISGTPGLYAKTMVALVQSHGHEVWTELDTAEKVVVCGRRKGTDHVERAEWTVARARKAGYTTNKKYETDPQAMLYARAASDVCRKIAADALAGLAYSSEELELEASVPATRTVTRSGEKRTVARKTVAAVPDEPDEPSLDDEPATPAAETEPEPAESTDAITDAQKRKIMARFNELGIEKRENRLDLTRALIDAPTITSANELTKDQASVLIDLLDDEGVQDASDLYAAAGLLEP